jgi:hypothetical protein
MVLGWLLCRSAVACNREHENVGAIANLIASAINVGAIVKVRTEMK